MRTFLKNAVWFVRMLMTPSKPILQVEIEIVQFLAQRGESTASAIHEALTQDFDMNAIKPYTYVSFGAIYAVLAHLEEYGVVRSRFIAIEGKNRRLAWTLTGRGPKKPKLSTNAVLNPSLAGA